MNFTAQQALPCSLDVAKYFSCQGYNQDIHINQQLTRTSSLSANGYESTALTAELQALEECGACYMRHRQRRRAGIVTTKGTNATGIR